VQVTNSSTGRVSILEEMAETELRKIFQSNKRQ